MGRISFDEAQQIAKEKENQGGDIAFFTLKKNRDTATVRFLHNGLKDIETLAIHYVKTRDGKTKAVSCARGPKEPVANCPLCAAARQGENMQVRYYIHLLEYTKNEQGEYVGEHKVFDRGSTFIKQLESYAARYNPLHAHVFDIERIGEAGSRETSYNIIPLPDTDNEKYPYYEDELEYTPALGTIIAEKTYDQLQFFVENGYFAEDAEKAANNSNSNNNASYAPRDTYSAPAQPQGPVAEARRRDVDSAPATVGGAVSGPRRRV